MKGHLKLVQNLKQESSTQKEESPEAIQLRQQQQIEQLLIGFLRAFLKEQLPALSGDDS